MMFYYWKEKGVRPSVLYNMDVGEKLVISAFYEKEIEERQKSRREIETKNISVFPVTII